MLTVIVIIGIVLAMGIPAITNLMKSGGVSAASREVSSTLNLARQYAITHRTITRVVFPCRGTLNSAFLGGTNVAPWYQSYAVIALGSTTNYLTKWEFLPLGTVFMDQNNPNLSPVHPPASLDNLTPAYLPFPTNWNTLPVPVANGAVLTYIEFGPTGAARQTGALTITEGLINSGTIVVPTSKTVSNGFTVLANAAYFSVDNIIGRIQMTRP